MPSQELIFPKTFLRINLASVKAKTKKGLKYINYQAVTPPPPNPPKLSRRPLMKGRVLGPGVIAGEDEQRYKYEAEDFKGEGELKPGDELDFVIEDGKAKVLYIGP